MWIFTSFLNEQLDGPYVYVIFSPNCTTFSFLPTLMWTSSFKNCANCCYISHLLSAFIISLTFWFRILIATTLTRSSSALLCCARHPGGSETALRTTSPDFRLRLLLHLADGRNYREIRAWAEGEVWVFLSLFFPVKLWVLAVAVPLPKATLPIGPALLTLTQPQERLNDLSLFSPSLAVIITSHCWPLLPSSLWVSSLLLLPTLQISFPQLFLKTSNKPTPSLNPLQSNTAPHVLFMSTEILKDIIS